MDEQEKNEFGGRFSRRQFTKLAAAVGLAGGSSVFWEPAVPQAQPLRSQQLYLTYLNNLLLAAPDGRENLTPSFDDAYRYCESVLNSFGYVLNEVADEVDIEVDDGTIRGGERRKLPVRNLVARSVNQPDTWNHRIVVCAHLDSAPGSLGANDNATGAAGLLYYAEMLRHFNQRAIPRVPFEIIFFGGEEKGLIGSKGLCKYRFETENQRPDVYRVVNLDTLGSNDAFYPPYAYAIEYHTDHEDTLFDPVNGHFSNAGGYPLTSFEKPESRWASDHLSFLHYQAPALLVTQHHTYLKLHTPEDTADAIDPGLAFQAVDQVYAYLSQQLSP